MGEVFRRKFSDHKHPPCWIPECEQWIDNCEYVLNAVADCPRRRQIAQGIQKEVNRDTTKRLL
jgi:hypothetical protein